ncbi:MAG TPA: hypothetical protein ENH85_11705 [Candidatus Scalindua sp.]|nr:hypothetical protein [Candidatus Scalindua sp.]
MAFKKGHTINNGRTPWNKGKKNPSLSERNRKTKKNNKNCLGKHWKMSDIGKKNIAEAMRGEKNPFYGKKHSDVTKETNRQAHLGKMMRENNPAWQNGKSFELYGFDWTELLRHSIRTRDCFTCQVCKKNGWIVHHIDYDKKNNNPDNLITLCRSCHGKTNHNEEYWINYFKNL